MPVRRHEAPLGVEGSAQTQSVLARYIGGDQEAARKIFERCRGFLVRRATGHPRLQAIRREISPEDVAHEVLWRALSSRLLERFEHRGKGSLEAALSVVLDRTLVDLRRRLDARKRGGDHSRVQLSGPGEASSTGLERLPTSDTTPTSQARANELVELADALLTPRERQVWRMIELGGLDSEETARRLGITGSAARGLRFRAQARLVRALGSKRPRASVRFHQE